MQNILKLFALLSLYLSFTLAGCNLYFEELLGQRFKPVETSQQLASIQELRLIEITLDWHQEYNVFNNWFNFLISYAYAVLPPNYQPHYQHTLKFDHDKQLVIDTYQLFEGMDSKSKTIFRQIRDTKHYQKLKSYLEDQPYLCQSSSEQMGWVGPIQPVILFVKIDGTQQYAHFPDNPSPARQGYQLCSKAFADYLQSLQSTR